MPFLTSKTSPAKNQYQVQKEGFYTNESKGRAPERGFYMYFPSISELGFIPEANAEAAIAAMENDKNICKNVITGLRAALNDAVFPMQKVIVALDEKDQVVFVYNVPSREGFNGMVEFSFNEDEFMKQFPTAVSFITSSYTPDQVNDWDNDFKVVLKKARKRQFAQLAKGFA